MQAQLIRHMWSTSGSIWELQVYSEDSNKWFAITTQLSWEKIVKWCEDNGYPIPKEHTVEPHN